MTEGKHVNGNVHPLDIGILAIEIYFPKNYVDQEALEDYDKVSSGKYTIGLGQTQMSFCYDNEDINSLCLTVVANLMERNELEYKDIGRLEVGTETIVDKSKSVKTVLMKLFEKSGNYDVEGVDTSNACYGGTSALFNAVAWVESSSWDGRYALVVCGDIAVYATGPARCTGGAGAIAMLIGPNAPLVMEPGLRGSYMRHSYDFYKPDFTSEYPKVDGKLSVKSYSEALDSCYEAYCRKANAKLNMPNQSFCLQNIDFMLFHCPFARLVQKSFARMVLSDVAHGKRQFYSFALQQELVGLQKYETVFLSDTILDRDIVKECVSCSKRMFDEKTSPSLFIAIRTGNMYTPSLYSCLVSLLIQIPRESLIGKRIGLFSYGSGLASSMFSLRVSSRESQFLFLNSSASRLPENFSFNRLMSSLSDVEQRIKERVCVPPDVFTDALQRREEVHGKPDYKPIATCDSLFPGTYYLTEVDENFRRSYERTKKKLI